MLRLFTVYKLLRHLAYEEGRRDVAILLTKDGVDADIVNKKNLTAIQMAQV